VRADLHHGAADRDAGDHLAGDGAGGDARRRLAGGGASAAAIIAQPIFGVIDVIGVAGPVFAGDVAVILGALVGVLNHERNRRSRRHLTAIGAGEDAGEDLHLIRLAPLRGEARLTGFALVEEALNIGLRQLDKRRAAVDDGAERDAVAFAECRDAEEVAEAVM